MKALVGLRARSLAAPLAVTIASALLRGWRLGTPTTYVFDEVYYVPNALSYLHGRVGGFEVHPPLGKWLIAAGIRVAGDQPWGWRFASLVFGCLGVVLTYVLARTLLRSNGWATLAAALVATDGLQIVQSRVAMLDIFLSTFVLAGALFALLGKEGDVRWLAGAGVMLGAALAVKWSALPVIVLTAITLVATAPDKRRTGKVVAVVLGLVPLVVYVLSYGLFWKEHGLDVAAWVRLQRSILAFHRSGVAGHPYASLPVGWLLLIRPVAYFFHQNRRVEHILAVGNPVLWWAFLLTIPALVRAWLARRDGTADVCVLATAALYVPWLLGWRTSFLYYVTPLVPFMAIAVIWGLRRVWASAFPRRLRRGAVIGYFMAAFAGAALLYPVWVGLPLGHRHWARLMIFKSWI